MTGSMARGLLAVILCVASVPVAWAQPSAAVQQKATDLVNEGIRLQSKRDFDGAVGQYKEAYCLIPEPALVYNIGTAYQEGGRNLEAASYFRMYLKVAPSGDLAGDAKTALKAVSPKEPRNPEIGSIVCETERPKPRPVCIDGAAPIDGVCPPVACGAGMTLENGACVAVAPSGPGDTSTGTTGGLPEYQTTEGTVSSSRNGALFYAGLGTGAVGVIALGAGLAYGIKAKNASDALSEHTSGPWTDELLQKEKDGKAAERNQIILSVVGGVAVVGGAVMIILSMRSGHASTESARFVPVFTGDQAGVAFTTRY